MPLHPDLERLVSNYPQEIVVAVKNMMEEASGKKINLLTLKKLITKHLDPLLPQFNISKTFTAKTTWDSIEKTGKYIANFYSGNKTYGGIEYCVGETLRHLVRSFPRKATKRYKLDPYDTPGFCYLCWRHTQHLYLSDDHEIDNSSNQQDGSLFQQQYEKIITRKFCYVHDPDKNNSSYRHGKRLLSIFHKEINTIKTEDKKVNAMDSFPFNKIDHRASPYQVKKWIKKYRPAMWKYFKLIEIDSSTNSFFSTLLSKIDDASVNKGDEVSREGSSLFKSRENLHKEIANQPAQLSGILLRCEAWLRAKKIRRDNWGGARANSRR